MTSAEEELVRLIYKIADERVEEQLRKYDEYVRSGRKGSMSFGQYSDYIRRLDHDYRMRANPYDN